MVSSINGVMKVLFSSSTSSANCVSATNTVSAVVEIKYDLPRTSIRFSLISLSRIC